MVRGVDEAASSAYGSDGVCALNRNRRDAGPDAVMGLFPRAEARFEAISPAFTIAVRASYILCTCVLVRCCFGSRWWVIRWRIFCRVGTGG